MNDSIWISDSFDEIQHFKIKKARFSRAKMDTRFTFLLQMSIVATHGYFYSRTRRHQSQQSNRFHNNIATNKDYVEYALTTAAN